MKFAVKIVEVPGLPNLRCFAASLLKTEAPDCVLDDYASSGSIDLEAMSLLVSIGRIICACHAPDCSVCES